MKISKSRPHRQKAAKGTAARVKKTSRCTRSTKHNVTTRHIALLSTTPTIGLVNKKKLIAPEDVLQPEALNTTPLATIDESLNNTTCLKTTKKKRKKHFSPLESLMGMAQARIINQHPPYLQAFCQMSTSTTMTPPPQPLTHVHHNNAPFTPPNNTHMANTTSSPGDNSEQPQHELSSEELAALFKKKALQDPNSIDKWTRDFLEASVPEGAFSAFVTTSTAIKQGQIAPTPTLTNAAQQHQDQTGGALHKMQRQPHFKIQSDGGDEFDEKGTTTTTDENKHREAARQQEYDEKQRKDLEKFQISLDFKPTPLKYKLQHELAAQRQSADSIGRFEMNTLSYAPKQEGYPEGFDVVIVGGGHAGCEAAAAAARSGVRVALITHRFDTIGAMSCNPSIGGVGKGTLVREVDAMDGLMARVSDESGIQYKILNRSRGPAVQGPRAQIDRGLYAASMQSKMSSIPNLEIIEASVEDMELDYSSIDLDQLQKRQEELDMPDRFTLPGSFDDNEWFGKYKEMIHNNPKLRPTIKGVTLHTGQFIPTNHIVLCTGTFLRSVLHIGPQAKVYGGRYGDIAAVGLANKLEHLGFRLGRVTTGTPPRLDGRTINYDVCAPQHGDTPPQPFSFLHKDIHPSIQDKQIDTFITHTNESTNALVAQNWHDLPKFEGNQGRGRGPRYCVSLEGKVRRYPDRLEHRVWLEQEGYLDHTVYPQGVNTAFSPHLQLELMRTITGCEKVEMIRPGYAVEYDYVDPRQSSPSLENGRVRGLFIAGQPNGTTGYEEAAAQGVIAGANAGLSARSVVENIGMQHQLHQPPSTNVHQLIVNNTVPRLGLDKNTGKQLVRDQEIYEEYFEHIEHLTNKKPYTKVNFLSTAKHLNEITYQPLVVGRERGYTGVMIDDLINKGATEPYRVFTARSEYRILLRSDNCDHRLTSFTHKNAEIVSNKRLQSFTQRRKLLSSLKEELNNMQYLPHQWSDIGKKMGASIANDGSRRSALHILANYDQFTWNDTVVGAPREIKKRIVSILDGAQLPPQLVVPDVVQQEDGTFTVDGSFVDTNDEMNYVCRPVKTIVYSDAKVVENNTTNTHNKNHQESDFVREVIDNQSNPQADHHRDTLNLQTKAKKAAVDPANSTGADANTNVAAVLLKPIWKEVYNEEIGSLVKEGKLDGSLPENNPISINPCYSSSTLPPTHVMVSLYNTKQKKNATTEIQEGEVSDEKLDELLIKHGNNTILSEVLTEARYATLITQALNQVKKAQQNQHLHIPYDFDYKSVVTLSTEEIEKLNFKKPKTIHEASLIPGLTPVGVQSIASQVLKFSSKIAKLQSMGGL